MTSHDRFPQQWPSHFALDAPVSPVTSAPPRGSALLDFTKMDAVTFEQFCWWLLQKDHKLVGCMRVGQSGTCQEGIDILAWNSAGNGRLHLFECKAWEDLPPSKMTRAVDAFLEGQWAQSGNSFTLILAQRDPGPLLKRWTVERERLRRVGIDAEMWDAHHLTEKAQLYPDILTRFFPFFSVETFANGWMERVAFYEKVSKSFFDPREDVAQWARHLMGEEKPKLPFSAGDDSRPLIDGIYRSISQYGNSWHFKGPWFHLSVILPDARHSKASAAINFNRPDMQGIVLTVDHSWLLTRFLFKVGAPLGSRACEIVIGEVPNEDGLFVLDLPHCRLSLQEEGVRELLAVADRLTGDMRAALEKLEFEWAAKYFPFVQYAGQKVALAAVPRRLWDAIGQFAFEHDCDKGDSAWHMFDGGAEVFRPYHRKATDSFDSGYHGIFYAAAIEDLSYTDEVVVLWQPGRQELENGFSARGWWSCELALTWFKDALLPEVKRWMVGRSFRTPWARLLRAKAAAAYTLELDQSFILRDLRQLPLVMEERLTRPIVETVSELQKFFYSPSAERYFIRKGEVLALFQAAAIAAKAKRGYVGYARSKLGIDPHVESHAGLIAEIERLCLGDLVSENAGSADGAFRALLEMLDSSEDHLDEVDRGKIIGSLIPFARIVDEAMFIRLHTKWMER